MTCCLKYRRTKIGLISSLYNHQRKSSRKRGYEMPTYTRQELKDWLLGQKLFHELFQRWESSNFDVWLKPSVDRIDDYKSYSFDNVQLMTWRENFDKYQHDRKNGTNTKGSKAVAQHTREGKFLGEYRSSYEAQRQTKTNRGNITTCCRGGRKTAGDFVWKYAKTKGD